MKRGDELETLSVQREVKSEVRDTSVMSWIILTLVAISVFGRFPREFTKKSCELTLGDFATDALCRGLESTSLSIPSGGSRNWSTGLNSCKE